MDEVNTSTVSRSTQLRAVVTAFQRLTAGYVTHFLDRHHTFPDVTTRDSIEGKIRNMRDHVRSARDMLSFIAT